MTFYILNVALILAGCLVFYKLLLQKETFFPLNRFILLGCLILAFSLPLIPVPQQWSFRKADTLETFSNYQQSTVKVGKEDIKGNNAAIEKTQAQKESTFKDISVLQVLIWTYWLGVIIFAINFIVQLLILFYRAYTKPAIIDGRFRIVELSGEQAPCSFGNNIFINPEKYDWDTYSQIILHEKIHIQQGHSYDILLAELALIFQWFNPFAWLYRKAMEDNLEFLTDNELLTQSDVEPESYQMSLIKVSAPHFPASLTTNYNQSILKKRLIMMNAKKSNINSTWKYLCIVPLLLVFVSLFNEPKVYGKADIKSAKNQNFQSIENEGTWFATIKDDKVVIRFVADEDGKNNNTNTFLLKDFKDLPMGKEGNFSLTRDPGTMNFTGKFEGKTGMGTYKFVADQSFTDFLAKEGVETEKKLGIVYYMVNLNRDFIKMLKSNGYSHFTKDDLIPLAAMNIDSEFISSIKSAGLENVELKELIPLKALGVTGAYVKEIKDAGYKNLTADKLITLKAQGITGDFIKSARSAKNASEQVSNNKLSDTKKIAKSDTKNDDFDEDAEFGNLIAKKTLGVTPEYIKQFTDIGIKPTDEELISMKSLGVTPEFIKSFEAICIKLSPKDATSFKSVGITPEIFNEYRKLGFDDLDKEKVISAKTTGTSPAFISSMKKKGFNYNKIDKYVQIKVLGIDKD